AFGWNFAATLLADPVSSGRHTGDRGIELGEVVPGLVHHGHELRPFEGDRGAFGIVLVVGVAVAGGVDVIGEVLGQSLKARERLLPFLFQTLTMVLHPPTVVRHPSMLPSPSARSRRSPLVEATRVVFPQEFAVFDY